jgi:hypothetical protein
MQLTSTLALCFSLILIHGDDNVSSLLDSRPSWPKSLTEGSEEQSLTGDADGLVPGVDSGDFGTKGHRGDTVDLLLLPSLL